MANRFKVIVGGLAKRNFGWTIPDDIYTLSGSNQGVEATYALSAYIVYGPDTTPIWALVSAPDGFTLSPSGVLTKAASVSASVGHPITVSVSRDTAGFEESRRRFLVPVDNANRAPTWKADTPDAITMVSGASYDFGVYASDLDGDVLTFSLESPTPSKYNINPLTGVVTLNNSAPVFTTAPSEVLLSYSTSVQTITFVAVDPEGLSIRYELMKTRGGITLNSSSSGVVSVTSEASGTTGIITIRAHDGVLYKDHDCNVIVQASSILVADDEYFGLSDSNYPLTSPYGGTYQIWQKLPRKLDLNTTLGSDIDFYRVGGTWAELEPTQNNYDWTIIDDSKSDFRTGLKEISDAGKKAVVWIAFSEFKDGKLESETPAWVVSKCALGSADEWRVPDSDDAAGFWGYPIWQNTSTTPANSNNPRSLWINFIEEFGKRYGTAGTSPYKNSIAGIYIGTFNAGGEFNLPANVQTEASKTTMPYGGLTLGAGGVLETYVKEILNTWLKYFPASKCIWESLDDDSTFCVGAQNATAYAINEKGCSARAGNGEFQWKTSTSEKTISAVFKRSIDPPSYISGAQDYYRKCDTKENMGPAGLTIIADEFENASKVASPTSESVTGTTLSNMYRSYRQAVLYGLHRSISWWMFPSEVQRRDELKWSNLTKFRTLADYARRVAGYSISTAPDAFVELQRWNDGPTIYGGNRRYVNVERFMIQRDTPADGKTVVAESELSTNWPYPSDWATGMAFYEARRTNVSGGSNRIYFQLNPSWVVSTERTFEVCVYYKDTGTTKWRIQYSSPTLSPVFTTSITNGNSGLWKTARFRLTNAQFRGAFSNSMDFCIWNESTTDLIVKNVRVIRIK